ncbi:MAG: DUF2064 domain-containing protein [Deltaproteobacteria bacterium]|nr:DUF2064 domain-containing protein [Deltaproteobacteria bacterium]
MPSHKRGAIAIFVKTPGLSPIKTRLAASIGAGAAERFHLLSAKAIESVVLRASQEDGALKPYWAVAEKEALDSPQWNRFQTIWQGDGGLGERLCRVYNELMRRHSYVLLIGADSPQMTSHLLGESVRILSQAKDAAFVMGRAEDGGFYLFGGSAPIARDIWLDVSYSAPTTASELANKVKPLGRIKELPLLLDVDTADDLAKLLRASGEDFDLTFEQRALLKWAQESFFLFGARGTGKTLARL